MTKLASILSLMIVSLIVALPRAAAESGDHTGEAADLTIDIAFQHPALWTTVSAAGTAFGDGSQPNPAFTYPPAFWGRFPGYYIGQTMDFTVTIANTADHGNKTFKLTVSAASNAVNLDGSDGVAIGQPQTWSVDGLAPGQSTVLQGSVSITGAGIPVGLDLTRITVAHPNQGGDPTAGIIKVATGVWCPPPSANN